MPLNPALRRLWQEDHAFKTSLSYRSRLSQKTKDWVRGSVVKHLPIMHPGFDIQDNKKEKQRKKFILFTDNS
jgi:hypothetical protein